jgi:predicted acyltransferase
VFFRNRVSAHFRFPLSLFVVGTAAFFSASVRTSNETNSIRSFGLET